MNKLDELVHLAKGLGFETKLYADVGRLELGDKLFYIEYNEFAANYDLKGKDGVSGATLDYDGLVEILPRLSAIVRELPNHAKYVLSQSGVIASNGKQQFCCYWNIESKLSICLEHHTDSLRISGSKVGIYLDCDTKESMKVLNQFTRNQGMEYAWWAAMEEWLSELPNAKGVTYSVWWDKKGNKEPQIEVNTGNGLVFGRRRGKEVELKRTGLGPEVKQWMKWAKGTGKELINKMPSGKIRELSIIPKEEPLESSVELE